MRHSPLTSALVRKLTSNNTLDKDDIAAIEALPASGKLVRPQHRIVSDGDRPSECCLVVDGFVYRSKTTTAGQRQILSIHISGEIPDLQSLHLHVMDHDLIALTECTLGFVLHSDMRELCNRRPNVAAALWRETLIDAAIFREWIVNVGRRHAPSRMAHLVLELHERLEQVGKVRDGSFELPMTQADLADCLGLSSVHVNRVLQQLRGSRLLAQQGRQVVVLDIPKLEELGQFDRTYLHQQPSV